MNGNLPPGVTDSMIGAPWNDRDYQATYQITLYIAGYRFVSDIEKYSISIPAPMQYEEFDSDFWRLHETIKIAIETEHPVLADMVFDSYSVEVLTIQEL